MWLTQVRQRARERADVTASCVVGLFALFLVAPLILYGPFDATAGSGTFDFDTLTSGIVWQVLVSLVLLAIVSFLAWRDLTKLTGKIDRIGLRPLYAILVYPIVGVAAFTFLLLEGTPERSAMEILLTVLLLNFFVGLSEELLFRGFLFGGLRQRFRLITAIMLSSVAFGMLHLINAGAGQSLPETLFQIINAAALGTLFCGLVLQANSLWPAIILHMVWNTYAMMGIATTEELPDLQGDQAIIADLSLWSLLLPALIGLTAWGVLYTYTRRTGVRLRDCVPIATPVDAALPDTKR